MRDRLIELLDEFRLDCIDNCSKRIEGTNECHKCAYSKIADHLLENGAIVPPLMMAEVIYIIVDNEVVKYHITKIEQDNDYSFRFGAYPCENIKPFTKTKYFKESAIGKTVFLTREEAEAKLKERKEDEGK